jgi:ubiquinone/menaquinone biosynthesis C-methylase UbiE
LTSPDHKRTYQSEADNYDLLISREDYQGNLIQEIERIRGPKGLDIVELGAGTGRLSKLLVGHAKSIISVDIAPAMLRIALNELGKTGCKNFLATAGDHRALPLADRMADLVISGWSICYLADWYPQTWKSELEKAFHEIGRTIRPGGSILLIETQGTGFYSPHPPLHLQGYFSYLEKAGFAFSWIRTDYKFVDLVEAESISRFFFGDELADQVVQNKWVILPECTGFWVKNL